MLIILMLILILFPSCQMGFQKESEKSGLTLMTWNVENLFDATLDGSEYSEYKPGNGWDTVAYRRRLKLTSDVIDDKEPDVVFLEEVENAQVLKDLSETYLARHGYFYYGAVKKKGDAIALGFLSKIKPDDIFVHNVLQSRSLLQLNITKDNEQVVLLGCHGKSRLGGIDATNEQRLALSQTIVHVLEDENPLLILACGDFNGDVDDGKEYGQPPLVDAGGNLYQIYKNKGSLCISGDSHYLVDTTMYGADRDQAVQLSKPGTYYYEADGWHFFDHIYASLAAFDHEGLDYKKYEIYAPDKLCRVEGVPFSWDRDALNGISDHFPVVMYLE